MEDLLHSSNVGGSASRKEKRKLEGNRKLLGLLLHEPFKVRIRSPFFNPNLLLSKLFGQIGAVQMAHHLECINLAIL